MTGGPLWFYVPFSRRGALLPERMQTGAPPLGHTDERYAMTAYLWITGTGAVVAALFSAWIFRTLPAHSSDGDFGHAMVGAVAVVVGAIFAVANVAGWLVRVW